MSKITYITLILTILFTSTIFAAFPPPGETPQVNLYSRADMCIDCNQQKADAFVLSLIPSYSVNDSEYYIYIVDPVLSSKVAYEVEAFRSVKTITKRRDMTTREGLTFEPLMTYARNVVSFKQAVLQKSANDVLNSALCDSALDAYSSQHCGSALMNELRNEATFDDIMNFNKDDYSVTIGAGAKVLNGSITLSGQGNNGTLRVIYNFDDGSIAVYLVKDGEIIELDLEFSKSSLGKTLKNIIADLEKDSFGERGILGGDLDDFVGLWGGHANKFCNLIPSYKMVQAQVLECKSTTTTTSGGGTVMTISCRVLGSTNVPQAAYTCS